MQHCRASQSYIVKHKATHLNFLTALSQFHSAKWIMFFGIIWFWSTFPYWVSLYRGTHSFPLLKTSTKDWCGGLYSCSCPWYTSLKLGARVLSSPHLAHRKPSSTLSRQVFILQRAPSRFNTTNAKLSKKGKHFGKCKVAKIFLVGLMHTCRHTLCLPLKTGF